MRISTVAITLLFSVWMNSAHAYYMTSELSCTPLDFRKTFPLKMRDQGHISWCFAHASADFLQNLYQIKEQISASDIAINYSQTNYSRLVNFFRRMTSRSARDTPPQTGFITKAMRYIVPQGYCPESVLPSDSWPLINSENQSREQKEILEFTQSAWKLQTKIWNGEITKASELPWYLGIKNFDQQRFFEVLKNTSKKELLLKIRNTACEGSRVPFSNNIGLRYNFSLRGKHVFQKMNGYFDEGLPVAIDFFSDILKNYDSQSNSIDSLHTVLLYGRKFDPEEGECTYLLKDSHGEDCSKYDPRIKCEGGYLWMHESKVFRSMLSRLFVQRFE